MAHPCKGKCHTIEGASPKAYRPYHRGFRYCSSCEMFIPTQNKLCPCCNTLLRYRPRSSAQAVIAAREHRNRNRNRDNERLLITQWNL